MKRTVLYGAFLVGCLSLAACQQHKESKTSEPDLTGKVAETSQITDCEIKVGDVTFTKSINGADTCVTILADGGLEFNCPGGLDFFCDPNEGKLSNNTLPVLLIPTDNTKPFTLTAKVTPEFTSDGLYNAADLFVYVNDTLWQKLAFEQDEYGNHRIVLHHRLCIMIEVIPALLAKIFPLKKFRQKDHVCSLCRRLSHHGFRLF